MTTYIYCPKTQSIYVDSQMTDFGIKTFRAKKVFQVQPDGIGEVLLVATGELQYVHQVVQWLQGKIEKPDLTNQQFSGHALASSGKVYAIEGDTLIFYEQDEHDIYTGGTGYKIALGAMLAGASAKKAMDIVMQVDAFTGGKTTKHYFAEINGIKTPVYEELS